MSDTGGQKKNDKVTTVVKIASAVAVIAAVAGACYSLWNWWQKKTPSKGEVSSSQQQTGRVVRYVGLTSENFHDKEPPERQEPFFPPVVLDDKGDCESDEDDEKLLDDVRSYYVRHVEQRLAQTKLLKRASTDVAQKIMETVNLEDSRFERNLVATGSMKQYLVVKAANEFDYNVKLNCDTSEWLFSNGGLALTDCLVSSSSDTCFPARRWGFDKDLDKDPLTTIHQTVRIVHKPDDLPFPSTGFTCIHVDSIGLRWNDLCHQDVVVPFYVRRRLQELMAYALKPERFPAIKGVKKVRLKYKKSGPALTYIITMDDDHEVFVDLSPYFDLPRRWPAGSDWPRPATRRWLTDATVARVKARGVQLVPKRNFDWLISFCHAEAELVSGMDTGTGCRKKCHRIMKHLNKQVWCLTIKPAVSSYALKNLWFWECERLPDDSYWSPKMEWRRLKEMIHQLRKWIRERLAPSYFYPSINMFANKEKDFYADLDRVGKAIDDFLVSPEKYLTR